MSARPPVCTCLANPFTQQTTEKTPGFCDLHGWRTDIVVIGGIVARTRMLYPDRDGGYLWRNAIDGSLVRWNPRAVPRSMGWQHRDFGRSARVRTVIELDDPNYIWGVFPGQHDRAVVRRNGSWFIRVGEFIA